jgi:hypothetical protein
MTPKEKAKELVGKFYVNIPLRDCDNKRPHKLALIAVDEILLTLNKDIRDLDVVGSILLDLIKYWQEVKQEIEKITKSKQKPRNINKCQYCGLENDNHKLSCPVIKVTMII